MAAFSPLVTLFALNTLTVNYGTGDEDQARTVIHVILFLRLKTSDISPKIKGITCNINV